MEIKLGDGSEPPAPGEQIYSWDDSWRIGDKGKTFGYPPATTFGWNPISANAAMYYMTGRPEYLDRFLELALPNPAKIPPEINKATFEGMPGKAALLHPIAYWHHYTSHIFPLIWDLIVDSPGITKQQRDAINSDLLKHTRLMEQRFNRVARNSETTGLSRHGLYYALNLFTASRHFNKRQPGRQWAERLDSVSKAMAWWLQQTTWGELDTVQWINTSIEPVITYYALAGHKHFISSGVAANLMTTLDALWQGYPNELSNKFQSISLMNKASWLLNDDRYAWLAQQPKYDFMQFRIGQSWWPARIPVEITPNSPLTIIPASESVKNKYAPAISMDKSFQFLVWRSGYGSNEDYLLVDGLNQGGRNPHHVAAITYLRHNDKPLLSGYENQLFVLRNGLSGNYVPKAAALDTAHQLGDAVYIRTTVPDGPFAIWQRHILHVPGTNTLVADKITAKESGDYELLRQWKTVGKPKSSAVAPHNIAVSGEGRVAIVTDKGVRNYINGNRIDQRLYATLHDSESITLFSSIYANPATGLNRYYLEALKPNAALLRNTKDALISAGPYSSAHIISDAVFGYLSPERLLFVEGRKLIIGNDLIVSESPVSVNWDLVNGDIDISTPNKANIRLYVSDGSSPKVDNRKLTLELQGGLLELSLESGTYSLTGVYPNNGQHIDQILGGIETIGLNSVQSPFYATNIRTWPAEKVASFNSPIRHIVEGSAGSVPLLWVVTGEPDPALHLVTEDGKSRRTTRLSGEPNVLETTDIKNDHGSPYIIVGTQGNKLYAFNRNGDTLWERKSTVADKFKLGSAFYAPWFTDPDRITGIRALLISDVDNDGNKEIIVGRPSTIEYWDLSGNLLQRIPMSAANQLGTVSEIELLATDQGKRILLGRDYCGNDAVLLLDENRKFVTPTKIKLPYWNPLPGNSTKMWAWAQRGISALHAADLDLDGTAEVIVSRSGNWNDLRVYSADGSVCRWMHSFGPANPMKIQHENGSYFIRDTLVADVTGDIRPEVTVALASGYIIVFSGDGEVVWKGKYSGPSILEARDKRLLGGFDNGALQLFDIVGNTIDSAMLGSDIVALATSSNSGRIYAGTKQGDLFMLEAATKSTD